MDMTRKGFIGQATAFAAALGLDAKDFAAYVENPFSGMDYSALRRELRAFYPPGYDRLECQAPEQVESAKFIGEGLDAWVAAHPGFDALDIRRESYLLMRKHFVPFLFNESPFYFEAGVNGGWSGRKARPARHVDRICDRFYQDHGLIPIEARRLLDCRMSERLIVCCGVFVDNMHHLPPYHTVFTKGFGGVRREVEAALAACPADDPLGRKELETALVGLDTIREIQLKFKAAAESALEKGGLSELTRRNYRRIAEAAARCPWEPPQTFFEGLNALWFVREILGYVEGTCNFALGRPDAWLIGLYRADLAAGRMTEAEARDLVARFLIIGDCHESGDVPVDGYDDHEPEIPITLGGCDRDGHPVYNELTRMFLDAHIGCDCVFPKLHCRISQSSPEEYLRKIGSMLMSGHAVFALFNDDRHVPQFEARGYASDRARDYIGAGCWDGNVDSDSDEDGANYLSVARVLELTVHRDPEVERKCAIRIDSIDDATSYEEVRRILYRNFIRFARSVLSDYTRYGRAGARIFPHPAYSMCLSGGLRTRRDTTDGGVDFRPRVVTLAFLANVVDSLCAIRHLCFEKRLCSLKELLAAVRSNWTGAKGEALRAVVLEAPSWGDDSKMSNETMKWWIDSFHDDIEGLLTDQGRPYEVACWIYREFMYWGNKMKATPDGRRDGDRLAQGFAPSEYRCRSSVTTVFNSIGSVDHTKLYASNANLAFDKTVMSPETFAAVFRVACKKGMHLLQPNCISVEELRDAQVHPECHRNLIIKVCGFSARFVSLSKRWQDEVIARHGCR